MQYAFEITRKSRQVLNQFFDDYSAEQLNLIPPGFSNNLIWNIGHVIVVQQMLTYNLSGLPMAVSDEMISIYRRGTKPENALDQQELDAVRTLLFDPVDKTEGDYDAGLFKEYREFTTMTGLTLHRVEDAVAFNNYHEATHLGIMMAIRKFI